MTRSGRGARARGGGLLAVAALSACGAGAGAAGPAMPGCPADRPVVLAAQADVARLASCRSARGVAVRSGAPLDLSALRALTAIAGDLVIGPTVAVDEVSLGALRAVGGAIHVVGNGLLRGLYLPGLETAGEIEIDGNASLATISLPRLEAVRGALRITDDAGLELVDVSALASIGGDLVLAGAPGLAIVEAARLEHAASVQLDAPGLPPDVADHLRAIAGAP